MMKAAAATALLCVLTPVVASPRPRGVGPEFAKFYKDTTTFTCISHPTITLPFSRVNDDYCDCPDGSDEPGTAACAYLSPLSPHTPATPNGSTLALPGFYCKNKGHVPAYIPFMNVNDGVCDWEICCDGSEEWEGRGGKRCEDRCAGIGKEWRRQEEERKAGLGRAARRRKEMVIEAARLRKEVEDRIEGLEVEIQAGEVRVKGLEGELEEVVRKERGKLVSSGKGAKGKMGILVGLARRRVEELRDALRKVRSERDAWRGRLEQLERLLATFKEEYNPNFNDEGVKRAVRAWEDYAAKEKVVREIDAAPERDLDSLIAGDEEDGLDWAEFETEEEGSETDVLYAFELYLPPTLRVWLDKKLRGLRIALIDAGILADTSSPGGGSESKAVTDARTRLTTAQKDLENQRKSLADHRDDLAKDFGPDDVFRALKGTCVSTDSGEYTYELCFLDRTTQKPKKGGGATNMGNFVGFDIVEVDDDLPADGRGLGSGRRTAMRYENGQHCWNGPNRSTMVVLACAEKDEVWRIVEEEKCVYRMEVGTPAVCEGVNANGGRSEGKDEL